MYVLFFSRVYQDQPEIQAFQEDAVKSVHQVHLIHMLGDNRLNEYRLCFIKVFPDFQVLVDSQVTQEHQVNLDILVYQVQREKLFVYK